VARFFEPDRYADRYPQSNPYAYCFANPLIYIDPNGDTVDVAKPDKKDYLQAVRYLSKDKQAAATIRELETTPEHVKLTTNKNDDDSYKNRNINWDPKSGLEVKDGTQSPALGLLHEMGHALNDLKGTTDLTKDSKFDLKEERNVIEGLENPAARTLKEPTRNDHGGKAVRVKDVTTHHKKQQTKKPKP
jgi:hypothetical protein